MVYVSGLLLAVRMVYVSGLLLATSGWFTFQVYFSLRQDGLRFRFTSRYVRMVYVSGLLLATSGWFTFQVYFSLCQPAAVRAGDEHGAPEKHGRPLQHDGEHGGAVVSSHEHSITAQRRLSNGSIYHLLFCYFTAFF